MRTWQGERPACDWDVRTRVLPYFFIFARFTISGFAQARGAQVHTHLKFDVAVVIVVTVATLVVVVVAVVAQSLLKKGEKSLDSQNKTAFPFSYKFLGR